MARLVPSSLLEGAQRIGPVAEATGLSTHAIRVWERRYGAVDPVRTPGGTRLYSAEHVARLKLLKALTEQGHAIGAIARLPTRRLEQLLDVRSEPAGGTDSGPDRSPDRSPNQSPAQRQPAREGVAVGAALEAKQPFARTDAAPLEPFFEALERLDVAQMESFLARAALDYSPRDLVLRISAPLAAELGRRCEAGQLGIALEHVASARLRDLLGRLRSNIAVPPHGPRLLAATLSGDRHELGLLMATLLAAMQGWAAIYLGVDVPLAQIVDAAQRSQPQALLLSLVHVEGLAAQAALRELRRELPPQIAIFIGGRAAQGLDISGVNRPSDLVNFENEIGDLRSRIETESALI